MEKSGKDTDMKKKWKRKMQKMQLSHEDRRKSSMIVPDSGQSHLPQWYEAE